MSTEPFDEDRLRFDITTMWGEHGAHADLFDHIVKLAQSVQPLRETLGAEVARLRAVLEAIVEHEVETPRCPGNCVFFAAKEALDA